MAGSSEGTVILQNGGHTKDICFRKKKQQGSRRQVSFVTKSEKLRRSHIVNKMEKI